MTPITDARPDVLLGETLPEYAIRTLIAACSAWSDVRNKDGEIDEAKCQFASALERRLRSAIEEIVGKSRKLELALRAAEQAASRAAATEKERLAMRDQRDAWEKIAVEKELEAGRLTSRAAAAEKDAGRYRWLREPQDHVAVTVEDENEDGFTGVHYSRVREELDAAIDAATGGAK